MNGSLAGDLTTGVHPEPRRKGGLGANAGGLPVEQESPAPIAAEERQPSCFALENEKGEDWRETRMSALGQKRTLACKCPLRANVDDRP